MINLSVFLTRTSKRFGWLIWIILLVLVVLSVLNVFSRGFNTNLLNLIPENAAKTHLYLKLIRDFGIMDETYVILDGDIMKNVDRIGRFADDLNKSDLIHNVRYRIDPPVLRFMSDMFKKNTFLYLNDDDLERALAVVRPDVIQKKVRKMRDRLILPSKYFSLTDPLGFSETMLSRMPSMEMPLDVSSGLFMTENGKRLFVIVDSVGEARDIQFDTDLIHFIEETFDKHFKDSDSIHMGLTGSHPITYYEQRIMKTDMQISIITAFLGVSLIFFIFFRTLKGMFIAFLPVVVSIVLTTSLSANVFGAMSEISGAFGAMLVGLGVDLSIVLYIRYLLIKDIERSVEETSGAIWTGVLTTAATFLPMVYSDFRGIRELGFMTFLGIIVCALFIFSVSAPLMSDKKFREPRSTVFESLPRFALRHKWAVAIFSVVTVLLALYSFKDLTLTADLRELGAKDNKAKELFHSLDIKRGSTFISGVSPSIDDLIKESARISGSLRKRGIQGTLSIASFIPDHEQQMRNIERIRSVDVRSLIRIFSKEAAKSGFSDDHIIKMTNSIRGFFDLYKPISFHDFTGTEMEPFLKKFYRPEGDLFRFLVMVNEAGDVSNSIGGYDVTGPEDVKSELSLLLRKNAAVITIMGILLVNIILYVKFRNLLQVLYAQTPVAIAILLTGAIMVWLGIQVHVMNALVAVMLFGIGTDYSIHLVHNILRVEDLDLIVRGTGRAITIAALTTVAGFGSLYFSSYRGLSEMGLAVTLGCLLTLFFSLALIPVFMANQIAPESGKYAHDR